MTEAVDSDLLARPVMPKSIAKALLVAQKAVQPASQDRTNTHFGYQYASAESLIKEGRAALAAAGLSLITAGWSILNDNATFSVRLTYFLCSESESYFFEHVTPVIPEKGRPADKAMAAAMTYDLGYTLRGLLLIPRVAKGEDRDADDDSGIPEGQAAQVEPASLGGQLDKELDAKPVVSAETVRAAAKLYHQLSGEVGKVTEVLRSLGGNQYIDEIKPEKLPAILTELNNRIKALNKKAA